MPSHRPGLGLTVHRSQNAANFVLCTVIRISVPKKAMELSRRIRRGSFTCKNAASRVCNILFMIAFLVVMVFALSSLGVFTKKHNEIKSHIKKSGHDCILFATNDELGKYHLSDTAACRFAIGGSAIVAIGAVFFLLVYLIKAVLGASV